MCVFVPAGIHIRHVYQSVDMALRSQNLQVPSPSFFFLALYLLKKLGGLFRRAFYSLCVADGVSVWYVQHFPVSCTSAKSVVRFRSFFVRTTSLIIMCLFQGVRLSLFVMLAAIDIRFLNS